MIKPDKVNTSFDAGFYQEECVAGSILYSGLGATCIALSEHIELPGGEVTIGAIGGIMFATAAIYAKRALEYHRQGVKLIKAEEESWNV